ncbi:MAG: hypothetical protein ACRDV1_06550 [Actinomycetes bacterium]
MTTVLEEARRVADVTLFEGYVLYPYRASARKNQLRWQFGVLTPPAFAASSGEPAANRTECLVEAAADDAVLDVQVRFLQAQRRDVEQAVGAGFAPTEALSLPDRELVAWDEGVVREADLSVPLAGLVNGEAAHPFSVPAGEETEDVQVGGRMVGRVVRRRSELTGRLWVGTEPVPGPFGAVRLRVRVENTTAYDVVGAPTREEALRGSLVAAHTLLALRGASFISMLDPPEWAAPAVAACANEHTWPVLVGRGDRDDVVLSAPIILYDHPQLAPESPGDLYDATEIDEILTLRTLALTDEEKREARGTDPRAAGVVDRVDGMPAEVLERLHGTVRSLRRITGVEVPDAAASAPDPSTQVPWWDPGSDATVSPETDTVVVDGTALRRGGRVRLRPGRRRADAQDMFLEGRTATVEAVLRDVDDETHLAVTLDDDPGADLARSHGRYLYFRPDEVEPAGVTS